MWRWWILKDLGDKEAYGRHFRNKHLSGFTTLRHGIELKVILLQNGCHRKLEPNLICSLICKRGESFMLSLSIFIRIERNRLWHYLNSSYLFRFRTVNITYFRDTLIDAKYYSLHCTSTFMKEKRTGIAAEAAQPPVMVLHFSNKYIDK